MHFNEMSVDQAGRRFVHSSRAEELPEILLNTAHTTRSQTLTLI